MFLFKQLFLLFLDMQQQEFPSLGTRYGEGGESSDNLSNLSTKVGLIVCASALPL